MRCRMSGQFAAGLVLLLLVAGCGASVRTTAGGPAAPPAVAKPATVSAATAKQLSVAVTALDSALTAASAGDLVKARAAYLEYDDTWEELEEGVRTPFPTVYAAVEEAMLGVRATLVRPRTPELPAVVAALTNLRRVIGEHRATLALS